MNIELKHIDGHRCPDCGCREIVETTRNHLHCSGEWNEHATYNCGYAVHFVPNFMKVQVVAKCRSTKVHSAVFMKVAFQCPDCRAQNEVVVEEQEKVHNCINCCHGFIISETNPMYFPNVTVRRRKA